MNFNANQNNRTTLLEIQISGQQDAISTIADWNLSDDILNLGDGWALNLPDPKNRYVGTIRGGETVTVYMTNPDAAGGARVLRSTGIVTSVDESSTLGQGVVIALGGADLGWHLQSNSATLHYRLANVTFQKIAQDLITTNLTWGISSVVLGNAKNRKLKQNGRTLAQIAGQASFFPPYKIFQVEPGQTVAEILVTYAQREGLFVNVSAAGELLLWSPQDATQAPDYELHYHAASDPQKVKNNVESYTKRRQIESLWTDVTCVWSEVYTGLGNAPYTPNLGVHQYSTSQPGVLPVTHRLVFEDGIPLSSLQAKRRALWKMQRGRFDAETHVVRVKGHYNSGQYWAPDSLVAVNNTVHGIVGTYYLRAVKFGRSTQGDWTELQLHQPGLLTAGNVKS